MCSRGRIRALASESEFRLFSLFPSVLKTGGVSSVSCLSWASLFRGICASDKTEFIKGPVRVDFTFCVTAGEFLVRLLVVSSHFVLDSSDVLFPVGIFSFSRYF